MKWYSCAFICYLLVFQNAVFADTSITVNDVVNYMDVFHENTELRNYGTINANIYTDGYDFDVYNYGEITETVYTGGGIVRQHVNSLDMLNRITVDDSDNLYVFVDGVSNVGLTNLINLGDAHFDIRHSSIVINDFTDWTNWDQSVALDNTDTLIISNASTVHDGDTIRHINSAIDVQIPDLDPAYNVELSQSYGAWIIHLVRDTNYSSQLDENTGNALRNLLHSNDPLIKALNAAHSTNEIERIMAKSYHFNSGVLMNPVKTIHKFELENMFGYKDVLYSGISGVYINADKTNSYGFDFNMNGTYNNLYLGAGFNFRSFKYQDTYNDFDGLMYGFNIKAKTNFDKAWMDGTVGLSFVDFDAYNISCNGTYRNDPMGFVWHGGLNAGYDYVMFDDFVISPFAGINGVNYRVLGNNDTDYSIRGGGKLQYAFVTDNIRYEYSGIGAVATNGDIYGSLKVGFVSEIDNAGISLVLDVLRTEKETGYKVSMNANVLF